MDPRRARDPRLARADPRRQQTGSPFNAPPPQATPPYPPAQYQNGVPQYGYQGQPQPYASIPGPSHVPTPPASHPPPQYSSGPVSNQQLKEEARDATSPPPPTAISRSGSQTSPQESTGYKGRPLFCVVCASNQVCPYILLPSLEL